MPKSQSSPLENVASFLIFPTGFAVFMFVMPWIQKVTDLTMFDIFAVVFALASLVYMSECYEEGGAEGVNMFCGWLAFTVTGFIFSDVLASHLRAVSLMIWAITAMVLFVDHVVTISEEEPSATDTPEASVAVEESGHDELLVQFAEIVGGQYEGAHFIILLNALTLQTPEIGAEINTALREATSEFHKLRKIVVKSSEFESTSAERDAYTRMQEIRLGMQQMFRKLAEESAKEAKEAEVLYRNGESHIAVASKRLDEYLAATDELRKL